MCVDDQILSSYVDGELDAHWKEKVEAHIAQCEQCRLRVSRFQKLSADLSAAELRPEAIDGIERRVAARLEHLLLPGSERGFWNRRFSIPAPVAMAALFCLVFLSGFVFIRGIMPSGTGETGMPIADEKAYSQGLETLTSSPAPSMSENPNVQQIFDLLENSGGSIEVRIELPRKSNFTVHGEPQLLRAADYRGGESR